MAAPPDLTDLHLGILGVLWRRRRATIAEVHAALSGRHEVSKKTVATLLSRLEERGLVRRELAGRESVYRAALSRRKVLTARLLAVLGALFEPEPAAPRAVRRSEVHRGDVARLTALLGQARRDLTAKRK